MANKSSFFVDLQHVLVVGRLVLLSLYSLLWKEVEEEEEEKEK
jgi:hypothetical protein